MTKLMKTTVLVGLIAFPQAVFAHAGDHGHVDTLSSALAHLFGSPFHIALMALAAGGAVGLGWVFRRRRQARHRIASKSDRS